MEFFADFGIERPTVGRIVHFSESDFCYAAIVVATPSDLERGAINLVFWAKDGTQNFCEAVPFSKDGSIISWHWPERV